MADKRPSRRTLNRLPAICVDEHITPAVASVFRTTFRVIEAGKDRRFRGRDERDFIMDLYRANAVFVTSDRVFADEFAKQRRQHAGAALIPTTYDSNDRILLAQIVRGVIRARCERSPFGMRNHVMIPKEDGLHISLGGLDHLEFSWTRLGQIIAETPPDVQSTARKRRR